MPYGDELGSRKSASDQQIWQSGGASEPLDYSTQVRRPAPVDEVPLRRPRQHPSGPSESPGYRLRDFSPEGRGTSFTATQPSAPAPWTPPAPGSGNLDYHTSVEYGRPLPEARSAPSTMAPIRGTAPATAYGLTGRPEEQTLTRRELRELRNATGAQVAPQAPSAPSAWRQDAPAAPHRPLPPQPEPSPELTAAMAEFDALFRAGATGTAAAPVREPFVAPPGSGIPPLVEPVAYRSSAPASPVASAAPSRMPPPPGAAYPLAEPIREVVTAPEVYAAPLGHWSNQPTVDEEYQQSGGNLSRDLSAIDAITTSALVLPAFPHSGSIIGPVSSTGEILITGSIDLPKSLALNGLHPSRYDRPDIDSLIEAAEREDSAPNSAPVRAIRAVSTHTSSQALVNAKRPKGNSLPMILSITAGVMMIGVVALVVAGMIFKIF